MNQDKNEKIKNDIVNSVQKKLDSMSLDERVAYYKSIGLVQNGSDTVRLANQLTSRSAGFKCNTVLRKQSRNRKVVCRQIDRNANSNKGLKILEITAKK